MFICQVFFPLPAGTNWPGTVKQKGALMKLGAGFAGLDLKNTKEIGPASVYDVNLT